MGQLFHLFPKDISSLVGYVNDAIVNRATGVISYGPFETKKKTYT